jgi:hypothetical protein
MKNKFNIPIIKISSKDRDKRQEELDYRNGLVDPNFIQHYVFISNNKNVKELHYTRYITRENFRYIISGFDIIKLSINEE